MQQSGCLTDCVICDAPENDAAFVGFAVSDGVEPARVWRSHSVQNQPCHWCWTEGAKERWEDRQSGESAVELRALFREGAIGDLD